MITDYGHEGALHVITKVIIAADDVLGGDRDFTRCQTIAANAMQTNVHRSFGFLVLAIRDGMNSTDKDSKAYGRITTQLVAAWTAAQEGKLMRQAEGDHARVTVKNDNLGRDYMDRLEHDAGRDKEKIAHLNNRIAELKNRLDHERE